MVSWAWVWTGTLIDLLKVAAYSAAFLLAREGHRRYSFAYGLFLNIVGVICAQAISHYLQRLKRNWQGLRQPLPARRYYPAGHQLLTS
ncbi:unnamed protein product [Linum trigynum]|uniref:Uncharacterized protein n=1 Tax=Linum trigynum TaxID=586398 RepID=A0AAV2D9G1_9ROSI